MSLNCPHAWEEYKKLDLAHDALRREYLALRDEQTEFSNVPKEWLVKMRGLRGRCLDLKDVFHNIEEKYNFIKLKIAEKILTEQFYGPQEIENAFGFPVDIEKIPKIPYSSAELKKAKGLGERLVLRISEDGEGNAMTMAHFANLAQARMTGGKLLWNIDWYKDEEFYKERSLRTEWKLVGGNLLTDSRYKTYEEQTKVLRDYLKEIGALTATEEFECSDVNLAKIAIDAGKLAGLEINQHHRRTPGEVLYDWFLHFKKFKDRDYLENNYDCTNIVSSDGKFVTIGETDSDRVTLLMFFPNDRYNRYGVVSVR